MKACQEVGTTDVVGVADLNDLKLDTVIGGEIWTVPGLGPDRRYWLDWGREEGRQEQ